MPRAIAHHRITVVSSSVDATGVSAVQFESPVYQNRARLPVWCGAYLLGSVFTVLWFVAVTGVLRGERPVDPAVTPQLELVMAPQPEAPPPTVVPPEKPQPQRPEKTVETRPPEPERHPQPLVAPTTNDSSPLPPMPADPPPASQNVDVASTPFVETSVAPVPIKIEPTFRLTRLPGFGNVKNMKNYPVAEKNRGREGTVIAEFTIDEKGAARDIKILKSAGALFDQAVIDHLSKTTFSPGYIGERPVAARFPMEFKFKLD